MNEKPGGGAEGGGVSENWKRETQQRRRRIAKSLWPRGLLIFNILKQRFDEEETFEQAAALAYKTLFSLLPILVLALLVLGAISSQNKLDRVVQSKLFEQLQLDKMPMLDKDGKPALDEYGDPLMLSDSIRPLLEKAKNSVTSKTTVTGLVALAILLYGAISLMVVIEGAFNQIYRVIKGRSWSRRILLYWCVLTLGPIGVGVSLTLGRLAFSTADSYAHFGWLVSTINLVTSFLVSWGLVLLLYKIVPETHVQWKSALMGSFVGAVLWEGGKAGFGFYVERSIGGSNFYGSLAILPLFMMWIYVTWTFILIGLQISYMHQYWYMLKRRYFFMRKTPVPLSDLKWALSLAVVLYRRFREGKALRSHEAAEELMIPNEICEQLLVALVQAGLVHVTLEHSYALARLPEEITAQDVMSAVRVMCEVPPELRQEAQIVNFNVSPAMQELEAMETRWATATTLPVLAGAR